MLMETVWLVWVTFALHNVDRLEIAATVIEIMHFIISKVIWRAELEPLPRATCGPWAVCLMKGCPPATFQSTNSRRYDISWWDFIKHNHPHYSKVSPV